MQNVLFDYGNHCLKDIMNYSYFKAYNNSTLWNYRIHLPIAFRNDYVWQHSKRLTLMKCNDCGELFLTYAIDLSDHDYAIFVEMSCDKCGSKNTNLHNTFGAFCDEEDYIKHKYSNINNWVEHISSHLYGDKITYV